MVNEDKISLGFLRGLLIEQDFRCAISGVQLNPQIAEGDHITPLSRDGAGHGEKNVWIVDKKVNQMKGTMEYDELIEMCELILQNREETKKLLARVVSSQIDSISKADFEKWVENNLAD